MILPCLYVGETNGRGRGMFTSKPLPEGKEIERAPVIVMSAAERKLLDQTLLHDYIFIWQPEGQEEQCCMSLGYIAVFNHSHNANCEYYMDYEQNEIYIRTVRNIKSGEELFINYNGDWDNKKPVWFEER